MNFPDAADEAAAREQQLIEVALANRPVPQMTYTGECHYCEEPIDKGHFAAMNAAPTMSAFSTLFAIKRWHDAAN